MRASADWPYALRNRYSATIADLELAGVEPSQARAIVHAINGAAGDPVSKEDFRELRGEFKDLRGEFGSLRGEFAMLKSQLTTRILLSQVGTATLLFMLLKFFA